MEAARSLRNPSEIVWSSTPGVVDLTVATNATIFSVLLSRAHNGVGDFIRLYVRAHATPPGQTTWRLPAVIEALQDVPAHVEEAGGQQRGVLYVGRGESFTVKKGQTFLVVKIFDEGGCRIEFEKRQYDVSSCPWLDGFKNHQEDVFKVASGRSGGNVP